MAQTNDDEKPRDQLIIELDALRATLQEYRVLLDESSDPIFAFYPDGTYRYVNQAFASGVRVPRKARMMSRLRRCGTPNSTAFTW